MGTTTNGFPYPESTDFVTDGAQAIEDLAIDVDERIGLYMIRTCTVTSTGGTAASASNGVITIGNGNTLVTVSDAFSANYAHYVLSLSDLVMSSSAAELRLRLGSKTTNYKYSILYTLFTNTASAAGTSTATYFDILTQIDTTKKSFLIPIQGPQLAGRTIVGPSPYSSTAATGTYVGIDEDTTQYTSFNISVVTSSFGGGKIRVYGYNN